MSRRPIQVVPIEQHRAVAILERIRTRRHGVVLLTPVRYAAGILHRQRAQCDGCGQMGVTDVPPGTHDVESLAAAGYTIVCTPCWQQVLANAHLPAYDAAELNPTRHPDDDDLGQIE